ncbi:MAG: hypothetical protein H0V56_10020 [Chthoniobacterales bacterium]|nr:hypothetical protein [Chthoniobacterales bacterium]
MTSFTRSAFRTDGTYLRLNFCQRHRFARQRPQLPRDRKKIPAITSLRKLGFQDTRHLRRFQQAGGTGSLSEIIREFECNRHQCEKVKRMNCTPAQKLASKAKHCPFGG